MLHIVPLYIWFLVLAASVVPDRSLSLISANVFFVPFDRIFNFLYDLLRNINAENGMTPGKMSAKKTKKKISVNPQQDIN